MSGFIKLEAKVLAEAVRAKRSTPDGWFKPHRRLYRYAEDLTKRGYLEREWQDKKLVFRIKAQDLAGPPAAPPKTAMPAGAPECAALGCTLAPRGGSLPFCHWHEVLLPEFLRAGFELGVLSLDALIIELGSRAQKQGVRF